MRTISERNAMEQFDLMLDDCFPLVKICGYEYSPSYALKNIDPVAYRQEFLNWADSENLEVE